MVNDTIDIKSMLSLIRDKLGRKIIQSCIRDTGVKGPLRWNPEYINAEVEGGDIERPLMAPNRGSHSPVVPN